MVETKQTEWQTQATEKKAENKLKTVRERLLFFTGAVTIFLVFSTSNSLFHMSDTMFVLYYVLIALALIQGAMLLFLPNWRSVSGIARRPFVSWTFTMALLIAVSPIGRLSTAVAVLLVFGAGILALHYALGQEWFNNMDDDFFV